MWILSVIFEVTRLCISTRGRFAEDSSPYHRAAQLAKHQAVLTLLYKCLRASGPDDARATPGLDSCTADVCGAI